VNRDRIDAFLAARHDKELLVEVPLQSGGDVRLTVDDVGYCPTTDHAILHTGTYYDADDWAAERSALIAVIAKERAEKEAAFRVVAELARGEQRYRFAWQSARRRAQDRTDALVEADDERDMLRHAVGSLTSEIYEVESRSRRHLAAWVSARQRARELRQDFELLRKIVMPDQDEEPPPLPPLVPLADANAAVLFARSDLVDTPPPLPDWFACPRTEDPCRLVFPAPLYPADRALEEQP
jgi:hypothetical protein